MNLLTKAVLFVILVVFINDVQLVMVIYGPFPRRRPWRSELQKRYDYLHNYNPTKFRKDNVEDRTINLSSCRGSNTIKGLTGEWDFHCSHNPKCISYESKSGIVNPSTGEMNYICRGYIKGISYSRGDNDRIDRQYSVSCCHDNQAGSHEDCYWTGWQNCFGSSFKFWAPDGYYMAGIRSEYNSSVKNRYKRIWDFYVCK